MSKKRDRADPFHRERRKIRESGVLDALIDYVEGKRDLSSSQVSAALGLLRKSISDLSTHASSGAVESMKNELITADAAPIEIRIVDAQR
jgi:hypothetical protein